ncbi:3-hydroxy-3-methylglutaryl-CoA reductase [Ignicoccus islandicus DSM 13165]|uniref:3-hydroxy-3-methylglutaryl coenzyme A reductase n=1 Tax=Ignicoccus islandicus DSM 13165 TaxID=940295 RepID=A0A0U3FZ85_9CREN|nr:hydroxymethylglutaryl-CoA reductase (NADPH) [Ignicoccus islandicus]ALU11404.1 3-hydroxy-3-methylglutaryl-CoA reductase [Ignicoccus islandicus DSM 13165]
MPEKEDLKEVIDQYLEKLERGELTISKLDKVLSPNLAAVVRRLFIERKTGKVLSAIASTILDFEELVGRNIENPIGAVQIPLGVAGPLKVNGDYAKGEFFIPLATHEGALVASINRGCKAVTESGGARAKVIKDGMARAPVFVAPNIEKAYQLVQWVREHFDEIKREAESTTSHGKLKEIQPFVMGNNVWLRFVYFTGDAMGMNMATIATEKACDYIEREFGEAKCLALSGNMCVDKKPAHLNVLCGRGKTVVAEAVIKEEVIRRVFKADAQTIHEVNLRKNLLGSAYAGSLSFNAHFANVIAAIFLATGQDAAQVVESPMGFTWTEVRGNDLYISVTLPSLEVGTVGGGTRLPTQREALEILGVAGGGDPPGTNALKFAEIVASAVLAGELNLLAALAAKELAKAHKALGRGMGK